MEGFKSTFSIQVFPLLLLGVAGGIGIGALPGLTATMGVAILLPFTFSMQPVQGLAMLIGIYIGAIYGGSISAILLKTPGTPAAAATVFDGYTMAQKGQPLKALSTSTIASFIGGFISTIMLITISPLLAKFALRFSAPEYFMLAIFGLTIIASISGKSIIKGFLAGIFGLFVATVGLDPVTSYPRFTFGSIALLNGLNIIPVLIGLFAVSEAFIQMEQMYGESAGKPAATVIEDKKIISLREFLGVLPTMLKSSIIGTFIGAIPGAGADIAAFVCYNEAKRSSKKSAQFGTGVLEGIAAPESGNNGVTGGALVPLLTLGVPGDAVTAILLGALIIQGLTPGPLLFTQNADVVYGVFTSMIVGNILMLALGLGGIRFFAKIVRVPKKLIIPIILVLSIIGSYSMNNTMFDVLVTFVFGIIGYLFTKAEIPTSPILLAIILGPMAETNLRKAILMYEGSWSFLWSRPITVAFILLSVFSLFTTLKMKNQQARRKQRGM